MDDIVVKNALSYALGSDLHEAWRAPRKKEDGTFEPRIKKSKDEVWNEKHGTNEVDIANCSFEELPSNWQYENLEAARIAVELVYDKTISGEQISQEEVEKMASIIHEEWLKRNDWVFHPEYGDPKLAVPYSQLSEEEKDKDKAQLLPAQLKVQDYINGLIDIEQICEQYNIATSSKSL
ncbi:MAG: hypothetical protein IJB83_03875 [Bacilli bacterium]|nr:hypothetical protein [Bacilli bacterium]